MFVRDDAGVYVDQPDRVTVPYPEKDLPIGTLKSIEKQAGIKLK